jgi:hypothetical protein
VAFGFLVEETPPTEFEIWPENYLALQVFCACSDDWNKDYRGQYLSINKMALGVVMEFLEVTNRKEMFTNILVMQNAVLEVLSHGR